MPNDLGFKNNVTIWKHFVFSSCCIKLVLYMADYWKNKNTLKQFCVYDENLVYKFCIIFFFHKLCFTNFKWQLYYNTKPNICNQACIQFKTIPLSLPLCHIKELSECLIYSYRVSCGLQNQPKQLKTKLFVAVSVVLKSNHCWAL